MTRHGKNATASSVYSYAERKKDSSQSGYGTLHARLGADSVKPFDCCCLSLQPCREPLISPDGYLFEKEAVLKFIMNAKETYKRELKAYEHHMAILSEKDDAKRKKLEEEAKQRFAYNERHLVAAVEPQSGETVERLVDIPADPDDVFRPSQSKVGYRSVSNMAGDRKNKTSNFWGADSLNGVDTEVFIKPDKTVRNPFTKKPLKYKDLLPVIFTPIDQSLSHAEVVGSQHRYMCPVTRDILTNSMRTAYLKTSSRVVNAACVEMLLKDGVDPLNGKPLTQDDVIYMHRGGTGFARTNMLKANVYRPQMATA